jgi:hypothetical protein
MSHPATCRCQLCYSYYHCQVDGWSVTHLHGDITIQCKTLAPRSALAIGVVLECAAKDAQDWRDQQLSNAGISSPPTLRSIERTQ